MDYVISFNIFVANQRTYITSMEEVMSNLISTTLQSFDFPFCAIVNIATYLTIKWCDDGKLTTWNKRQILLLYSVLFAIVYYITGSDIKTIMNSIILAPVAWSWIFKPICKKFNIDYKAKSEDK